MKHSLLVIGTFIVLSAYACGQTLRDTLEIPHVHVSPSVIDGSKNPELIPDVTAYRLFLVAVSDTANASSEEKLRHGNLVKRVGLTDADEQLFANLRGTFRTQYDELIKSYNDEVQAAIATDTAPNLDVFLAKRDALVQGVLDKLKTTLSTSGATQLNSFIQAEKAQMKIQQARTQGQ